jgi:hypothetical protein
MKKGTAIATLIASVVFMTVFISGCGPDRPSRPVVRDTTNYSPKPIQFGVLRENLRIEAEDGSFELLPGQQFVTPFENYTSPLRCVNGSLLEGVSIALSRCGAQRVRVYVEGQDTPLYGVLMLNRAIMAAYGPGARSYEIYLAPDKVAEAVRGRTAVSYEIVNFNKTNNYGKTTKGRFYSWALWVSKYPL